MSLQRIAEVFEALRPQTLHMLDEIYNPQAHFKDPFNDVTGIEQIRAIFSHMFTQLREPKFEVHDWAQGQRYAYLYWTLNFINRRGEAQSIRGLSQLKIDIDGYILSHEDFWDPAEQLYQQIPLLGGILRYIRSKLTTPKP